jgi:riboflavin synthase
MVSSCVWVFGAGLGCYYRNARAVAGTRKTMFTGIVQHVGRVVSAKAAAGGGRRLSIEAGPLARGLAAGGSLAVNGACLTARTVRGGLAEFDAVAETTSRTTLGALRAGDRVNLERPLRLADSLDGHLVQGHVDGLAVVSKIAESGPAGAAQGQWLVSLEAPPDLADCMVPKGSVALDGVSLTLVDVSGGAFRVALIPETLERTTLGEWTPGRRVNVETDLLGKYVRKFLAAGEGARQAGEAGRGGGITLETLRQAGFA